MERPSPFGGQTIVLGISGASCSGKTTLSSCLRQVLPNCVLMQQDDYFLPEAEIPLDAATGVANWDIPSALRFEDLIQDLDKERTPPISTGASELNDAAKHPHDAAKNPHHGEATESLLQVLRDEWNMRMKEAKQQNPNQISLPKKIILLDGFLLYHNAEISKRCDLRLLLWAKGDTLKYRRQSRSGYLTAEDAYWVDPPDYWDNLAWPAHVAHHQHICDLTPTTGISKRVRDPATDLEYHLVQSEDPWSREDVAKEVISIIARSIL